MPNYVGYRYWRVTEDHLGIHLHSMFFSQEWRPDEILRATHFGAQDEWHPAHPAPQYDCECGIYAFRTAEGGMAGKYGNHSVITRRRDKTTGIVLGAVLTGGRVVFHGDQGIRVAQAQPLAFALPDDEDPDPLVTQVARLFHVAVVRYRYLESYVREFGERIRVVA